MPNENGIKVLLASKTTEYIQEIQKKSSNKNDNNIDNNTNNENEESEKGNGMESSLEIGEQLYDEGKYSEAVEVFLKLIEEGESNYFAQYNVGLCYLELKEYSKAEKHLNTASILRPSYSSPYTSLASLYFQQNQFSRALSFFQLAEQLHPSPLTYYYIGIVYYNLKEYNKAISYYEKAIDLHPSYAGSHNGIGVIYWHKKEYEAMEVLNKGMEKAIQMGNNYSIFIANKAWTMIKKKEYENGLNEIQKSTEKTAKYYFIMGLAHYKLSQYQHAIHHFQLSLLLSPQRSEEVYF